jgi:hypothetical protein
MPSVYEQVYEEILKEHAECIASGHATRAEIEEYADEMASQAESECNAILYGPGEPTWDADW